MSDNLKRLDGSFGDFEVDVQSNENEPVDVTMETLVPDLGVLYDAISASIPVLLGAPCALAGPTHITENGVRSVVTFGGDSLGELTVVGAVHQSGLDDVLCKVPELIAPWGSSNVDQSLESPDIGYDFQYKRNLADSGADGSELKITLSLSIGPSGNAFELPVQDRSPKLGLWFAEEEHKVNEVFLEALKTVAATVGYNWKFNAPDERTVSQAMMRDTPSLSDVSRLDANVIEVMCSEDPPPALEPFGAILLILPKEEGVVAARTMDRRNKKRNKKKNETEDRIKETEDNQEAEGYAENAKIGGEPGWQTVLTSVLWQVLGCQYANDEIKALSIKREGVKDLYELRCVNTPHVRMALDFVIFYYFPRIYFGYEKDSAVVTDCFNSLKIALRVCYQNARSSRSCGEQRVANFTKCLEEQLKVFKNTDTSRTFSPSVSQSRSRSSTDSSTSEPLTPTPTSVRSWKRRSTCDVRVGGGSSAKQQCRRTERLAGPAGTDGEIPDGDEVPTSNT